MTVLHGFPYPCSDMICRQLIVGIIASLFMFSATELHQLLRIPGLISHYKQHSRNDSSLSFGEFMQLHYTAAHPDDEDEQDDQELPFKSLAGINHLDQPWSDPQFFFLAPCPLPLSVFVIRYEQGIPCKKVDGIFHPPRIA